MKRAALVLFASAVVVTAAHAAQSNNRSGTKSSGQALAGYSAAELAAMANSHPWVPGFQARYRSRADRLATAPAGYSVQELRAMANSHPWVPGFRVRYTAH
jgi:hypothetical protein